MEQDKYLKLIKNYGSNKSIQERLQCYKDRLYELKKIWEYEYDIDVKFDLLDLLEEIRHEFDIPAVKYLQREYRRKNSKILDVYFAIEKAIYSY